VKIIKFSDGIYKKEAIVEAISAYSHLAKFTVKRDKGYIKVKIDKIDPAVKGIMADEFSNYVLGATKRCL